MKAASILIILVLAGSFQACQNSVVVVDAKTGRAVPGATVYKTAGNFSTVRHRTDACGTTAAPSHPGKSRWSTVVAKPGYQTARF